MSIHAIAARAQQEDGVIVKDSAGKKWYTGRELLEMGIQEVPMLWESFIPSTGISILAGASDCGKSTILRQMATAICGNDTEFLGYPLHIKHANVIVVSTEDDVNGVAASLSKQAGERDAGTMERVRFLFDSENVLADLESCLNEKPADAVLIDGWGDVFIGNPNDYTAVRAFMNKWAGLSKKYGCAIVFIHHTVKHSEKSNPDKNRVDGSQALEARARTAIELRQGQNLNERILSILKGNYLSGAAKEQSLILEFDESNLTFSNTGKSVEKSTVVAVKRENYNWLRPEVLELKTTAGKSNNECREAILAKYGTEKTPGLTWFKEVK